MRRAPFLLIDHDYKTYVSVVNQVLGSLLVTMEELAANVDRHPATIRSRVRLGTFPPPIKFGGRQKFWLRDEVDEMLPALEEGWSEGRQQWLVTSILNGRLVLLNWLLHGCPVERSKVTIDYGMEDE